MARAQGRAAMAGWVKNRRSNSKKTTFQEKTQCHRELLNYIRKRTRWYNFTFPRQMNYVLLIVRRLFLKISAVTRVHLSMGSLEVNAINIANGRSRPGGLP